MESRANPSEERVMARAVPKAVVLLSGGMDSCVTAAIAQQAHELALVHVSYGQRTERRERRAFEEIGDFYEVRDRLTVRLDHFPPIGGSALTGHSSSVPPTGVGAESPGSFVPFLTAHFLSGAVRWIELGAPLDRTWSCYQFEDEACGVCDSCLLRLRAFARAGVADPLPYRTRSDSGTANRPVSLKASGRVAS